MLYGKPTIQRAVPLATDIEHPAFRPFESDVLALSTLGEYRHWDSVDSFHLSFYDCSIFPSAFYLFASVY